MENNSPKVFTNNAILVATFFGGPFAAGLLVAKNYKVFGNENAARNSVFIGILSTVLLFGGIFLTPDYIIEHISQPVIPAIYTGIIALLVNKLQGKKINEFIANNGQKASNVEAAKYGFLGTAVIAGFILLMFLSSRQGYTKSMNIDKNVVLHYTKNIEESKSKFLSEVIKLSGFAENSDGADLFFSNENNFYSLKIVIPDTTLLSDSAVISDLNGFENYLNYNLNLDKKIEIWITDPSLSNDFKLKDIENSIPGVYDPLLYLQSSPINNYHTIYYNVNMPLDDIEKVEDAIIRLKTYFPVYQPIDIIFLNNESDYTIKFFVEKRLWENPDLVIRLQNTVEYIKDNGLKKSINLILIDTDSFEEIKI